MAQAILNLGFSISRNTGGMRTPTGPNAATIASTQPGNYLTNATLHPAPTQAGGPITPTPTQWAASTQQSAPAIVAQTQLQAPTNPYVSNPYAGSRPAVGAGQAPVAPPPPGGGLPGISPPGPGSQRGGRVSRRALLVGGSVAVLAAAAGIYVISRPGQSQNLPPGETIPVAFAYSTEKAAWLQPAVAAFNNSAQKLNGSNKVINVQLTDLGSVDGQSQILSGQLKPVAWSPASNLEINRLNYKWQQAHKGASIINYNEQFQPRSLVKSPLVLAAWQERAHALLNHYQVPTLDWDTLHAALGAQDWTQVGGRPGWGPVKFGQTLPIQSNSGLLTITLLAYHYFKEARGLTIAQANDPGYARYLHDFEGAVNAFGHSSGTYLKNDIIDGSGPAQADIIATYESLVLTLQAEAQSRQHQPLLIYYPDVNILSDHPFVVLQGDWVTDEQKRAALQLRDFLLDASQQRLALSYGFRPANSAIALSDSSISNNPFVGLAALFPNRQPDALQSLAQAPDGKVVDALITNWQQNYPSPPTTDG